MRLAFMGTPDFAVPTLRALHAAGHEIAAVYCQPPRAAGRGHALRRCPIHVLADDLALTVRTPARLRSDQDAQAAFVALDLDAAVVVAYGLILPERMLDAPRRGCLNIHASLLPRWRGAGPIQAAILAGDAESGVTIMQMDAGLDTGPILLRQAVPITPVTTAADLHDTLAHLGAGLILRVLETHPAPVPQPTEGATYAPKLTRDDGRIDWSRPAEDIGRQIRAFDPWPGTYTHLGTTVLKVLAAQIVPQNKGGTFALGWEPPGTSDADAPSVPSTADPGRGLPDLPVRTSAPPGTVLDEALTIACGDGAVRLTRVQWPGRSALDTASFLRGHPIPTGTILGS